MLTYSLNLYFKYIKKEHTTCPSYSYLTSLVLYQGNPSMIDNLDFQYYSGGLYTHPTKFKSWASGQSYSLFSIKSSVKVSL